MGRGGPEAAPTSYPRPHAFPPALLAAHGEVPGAAATVTVVAAPQPMVTLCQFQAPLFCGKVQFTPEASVHWLSSNDFSIRHAQVSDFHSEVSARASAM